MPNLHFFAVLLTSVMLVMPATAQDQKLSLPMVNGAAQNGMSFSSGGEVHIAAMVAEIDGRIAVCGFWKTERKITGTSKTLSMLQKGLSGATVQYRNRALVRDLKFMNEVSRENYAVGTKAACKVTNKAWTTSISNKDIEIRIPRFRVLD